MRRALRAVIAAAGAAAMAPAAAEAATISVSGTAFRELERRLAHQRRLAVG